MPTIFTLECPHQSFSYDAHLITVAYRNGGGTNVVTLDRDERWIPVPYDLFMKCWQQANEGRASWTKVDGLPPPTDDEIKGAGIVCF
jgi:hypothetical protein